MIGKCGSANRIYYNFSTWPFYFILTHCAWGCGFDFNGVIFKCVEVITFMSICSVIAFS